MSDDFVVNDKRLFSKDGQVNAAAADDASQPEPSEPLPGSDEGQVHLPPANFPGLLVGLATSAFIHLGDSPGQTEGGVDLAAAKHSIDLLAVLQAKTQGNLEREEEALLSTLLHDLRLKFVQVSSKK